MFGQYSSLIKNKYFTLLWSSQILSQITIHIVNFALLIKLFEVTKSTIATSLLWVSYSLPAILIGPIAAVFVDMFDRKKILIITNFAQATIILLYALTHEKYFFLAYGVVIIYSFFNQFYLPSESSSLPSLVKKNQLPQANSLFFLTQQGAIIIGFGTAGFLQQYLGFSTTLMIASTLLLLAFVSVLFLPKLSADEAIPSRFEEIFIKFFTRIMEGYRFLKQRKDILVPFMLLVFVQIVSIIVMVNVPLIATEILNINLHLTGLAIVVPVGMGAMIGALLIPRLLKKDIRKKLILEYSLMALSISELLLIFLVPLADGYIKYLISTTIIIFLGISFIGILIPSQTYIQEATPGGYRGRVFGNFWFIVTILTILPVIFSGTISEILGIKVLLLLIWGFTISLLMFSKNFGQKIIQNSFVKI